MVYKIVGRVTQVYFEKARVGQLLRMAAIMGDQMVLVLPFGWVLPLWHVGPPWLTRGGGPGTTSGGGS
jgi:hypothetical protein